MLPNEYSQYSLQQLIMQLRAEQDLITAQVELRKERLTLEETYKAIIVKAAVEFEKQRELINQIAQLNTDLLNVDSESLHPHAKKVKKRQLRQLIALKEKQLAAQSQTLSAGDRRGFGQVTEGTPDPQRPSEST